ncbi:MAG TPA: HAD family acid phosphatase [Kofleriaceae bacterium]|nr:HAD family acid phosphatase [Kofleriaceae bacterium]
MKITPVAFCLALVGCASSAPSTPVGVDPGEAGDGGSGKADGQAAVPQVLCDGTPDAGPAGDFRHVSSSIIAALGDPRHRGFDLVAPASADPQVVEGWIAYTIADKALEDEDVDVFACRDNNWQKVGTTTTDDEGHFALSLSADDRMPIGLRDMYVSVVGDRTGTSFLAYVAPDNSALVVSDVDGTLTSSENAFVETIALGIEPDEQPGASDAYQAAAANGLQLVYVTARGNQYTQDTRQWLSDKGFPLGPVRLSDSFVTLPGQDTIDYKTQTISALEQGLTIAAGVGNRDSDITAYTNTNVAADRIYIKLPEYQSECQADLDAGKAVGFDDYATLQAMYVPTW